MSLPSHLIDILSILRELQMDDKQQPTGRQNPGPINQGK